MNFSEYTLVSFGDSYTFGQGTLDTDTVIGIKSHLDSIMATGKSHDDTQREFRRRSNKRSYTKQLEKLLGFKNSINLGIMGASNERTAMMLENLLNETDPNRKLFICINLTSPLRYEFLQTEVEARPPSYRLETLRGELLEGDTTTLNAGAKLQFNTLSQSFWIDFFTKLYTGEHTLMYHSRTMKSIITLLQHSGRPYVMFDGLNDICQQLDMGNINKDGFNNQDARVESLDSELYELGLGGCDALPRILTNYTTMVNNCKHYFNYNYYTSTEFIENNPTYAKYHDNGILYQYPVKNMSGIVKNHMRSNNVPNFGYTECNHWTKDTHLFIAEVLKEYIDNQVYV